MSLVGQKFLLFIAVSWVFAIYSPDVMADKMDPKWNIHKDGQCIDCHSKGTSSDKIKKQSFGAFCQSCHKSHKFSHTSSVGEMKMPLGFKTENKKIDCITCHEEPECRSKKTTGEKMLRGGPFKVTNEFCSQCHLEDTDTRKNSNPHVYDLKKPNDCLNCHTSSKEDDINKNKIFLLKKPPDQLCQECHKFETHHLMIEHMNHRVEVKEKTFPLPLTPMNLIYCGTCHTPHIKYKAGKKGDNTRGSTKTGELCQHCHTY